jgi:hypothetical protein
MENRGPGSGMENVTGPIPDPPVPDIDADGLMVPPWVKFPNLPKQSMGWRMGLGEHYRCNTYPARWSRQSRPIRLQLRANYPEPEDWTGYYRRLLGT